MLRQHWRWLLLGTGIIQLLVFTNFTFGSIKKTSTLDGWDLVGEGGAAVLSLVWLLLVLSSRPKGRVTNVFAAGLVALAVSFTQDFLDELVTVPLNVFGEAWIESIFMPLGMLCLTIGLFLWRGEQIAILYQLRRRERIFRRHEDIDGLTQIPDVNYLRDQLALEQNRSDGHACALLLLDLEEFSRINRTHGQQDADRLLQMLTELLVLNLRDDDLLCRYAGDRFAVLLPDTTPDEAHVMAEDLLAAVQAFTFRSRRGTRIQLKAQIGIACHDHQPGSLLDRALLALASLGPQTPRIAGA